MRTRDRDRFTTVRTEGGLLPSDLLERIVGRDADIGALSPADYHLAGRERIEDAVNRAWTRLVGAWAAFRAARERLPEDDAGTTPTRERWLLVIFQELGYGRLPAARAPEIEGKSYPISHFWLNSPIHLVGCGVDLDRRTARVAGAARTSPHSLVQEFLNRSDEHLWGFVSNGRKLRILRDNASLTRQAYLEFDLEAMFEGEVYSDFVLLWLLCHESRVEADRPERCWLERWTQAAQEQGARALEGLREGVEEAIKALGRGFLGHRANHALRERLRSGDLSTQDYYHQLLRLVYRLLFLFVAEDRDLLLDPASEPAARRRYENYYSTARLRRMARRMRATKHPDLYRGLRLVMEKLGSDEGCPALGLPPLGSFLWSLEAIPDLAGCDIANKDLLCAVRALAFTRRERVLRAVDFKNLGSEELGSVYESLLELHPEMNADAATFELEVASGHERKTTGSYYTPTSLIRSLLDTALGPVLAEAAAKPDPEQAILSLKICDPACGSGHFLIAAAHRVAKRLASIRTGDEEPSPDAQRTALRDVIGRSIYGVDLNPMAVELCKVGLWLESLEPGKPLSFLDHRIRCGNSLLGATPALIEKGIPDDAFKPITGDDKAFTRDLRKRNRQERREEEQGQLYADFMIAGLGPAARRLSEEVARLRAIDDSSIAGIHAQEARYRRLIDSPEYKWAHLVADAWCAAFVMRKTKDAPPPITHFHFERVKADPHAVPEPVRREVARLAQEYAFFHWHLAFPDVFRLPGEAERPGNGQTGWSGGFDVVLGNPPWEHTELKEKEWFATRRPDIAAARTGAARKRMIAALREQDPPLYEAYIVDLRRADGLSHLVRNSVRYPLCGRGRINTYAVFAEAMRCLLSPAARLGAIVPSGIATDDTTKHFFQSLMQSRSLASLYDFENRQKLFPAVDSRQKFCLLTLTGPARPALAGAEFAFFLHQVEDLRDPEKRFTLSSEDIALLNPNTRTCPVFRTRRDAEITKAIYRRVPVLIDERDPDGNPWGLTFRQGLFNMTSDSHLFRTREELEEDGWRLEGNIFRKGTKTYLPLYEAKMIHHFNHRFGDYTDLPKGSKSTQLPDVPLDRLQDPDYRPLPRYWVPEEEVEARLAGKWDRGWLLGWRDICRSTDERTVIASVLPRVGVGHKFPLLLAEAGSGKLVPSLVANLSTPVLDYAARQKIGGTSLTYFYLKQLPALPPSTYGSPTPWSLAERLSAWFLPRVVELTYTATDLEPFARDCGYEGPPFRWDEERRFLIRCELDAAFFHLYGIERDDVDYIMETFPIVKRNDEKKYGEYRTKRVILEIYDAMQRAIETGEPYQTLLDPPPADPGLAHPPREAPAPAAGIPFRLVEPREEDKYRTCVPIFSLKAAAGAFGYPQSVEPEGWAEIDTTHKLRPGMFVAQVTGKSMEPKIPDGAWCLFKSPVEGTRNGRIVLVQHHAIHDPDTGGSYTLKRYRSEKTSAPGTAWRHIAIHLEPLNPDYEPIVLESVEDADIHIVAEFLEMMDL